MGFGVCPGPGRAGLPQDGRQGAAPLGGVRLLGGPARLLVEVGLPPPCSCHRARYSCFQGMWPSRAGGRGIVAGVVGRWDGRERKEEQRGGWKPANSTAVGRAGCSRGEAEATLSVWVEKGLLELMGEGL